MPGGVQQSGAASEPIQLDPSPPQPQPGVPPILRNRRVESVPCCGPRNPVLRALRYLGGLLSRAFAAVSPCGARRDSALTAERAAERTRKQLARTLDRLPPAASTKGVLGAELRKLAAAHRRWIELDPEDAETRFDEMVETLVNIAPMWREDRDDGAKKQDKGALKLVEGLYSSQALIDCRKDMRAREDTASEAMLERLEVAVARVLNGRERRALLAPEREAVKSRFKTAIERIGACEVDGDRAKQNLLEVVQDVRARCVSLKEQGAIADVDAVLHDFMDGAVRDFGRILDERVKLGEGLRALQLLRELRESPPEGPAGQYAQALADTKYMREGLEDYLPDRIRGREFQITHMSYLEIDIARPRPSRHEFQRRVETAAQDGLERCRKLKEQGLISDPEETLRQRMPPFVQAAMPVGSPRLAAGDGPPSCDPY
jgi:hypothetical protein